MSRKLDRSAVATPPRFFPVVSGLPLAVALGILLWAAIGAAAAWWFGAWSVMRAVAIATPALGIAGVLFANVALSPDDREVDGRA